MAVFFSENNYLAFDIFVLLIISSRLVNNSREKSIKRIRDEVSNVEFLHLVQIKKIMYSK